MLMGEYIMGNGNMPDWVANKVMAYRKMDGSTGYEFRGMANIYEIHIGDKIIQNGHLIRFERKGKRFELKRSKRLSKPNKAFGQNRKKPRKAKEEVA